MAEWTPRLTRGLWGAVQRAVAEGERLADVRDRIHALGERPDAATLSRLYARAVEGASTRGREADYRGRVDPEVYLRRRPGAENIASLPYSLGGRFRQVIQVEGRDTLTGRPRETYVNVDASRLVSRGEAIEAALALLAETPKGLLLDVTGATYVATYRGG